VTLFYLLLISANLSFLTGCKFQCGDNKKKDDNKKETVAPVVVRPSWTGDISTFLRLNGILEPDREVQVFSKAMGRIVDLLVEEGDRVSSGQLLLRLENDEQKLAVERARNALEQERAALRRAENLFNQNMLAEDEFERIKLSVQDSDLELKQADLSYEYTRITAPFSGTIAVRYVNFGDRVDVARPLFKLVDSRTLHIDCWVAETDIMKLQTGQSASVRSAAFPDQNHSARLVRISPVVDPTFGKVKVTFELGGGMRDLKPGQFVELELTLETHFNTQLIPKRALVYEAGVPVVFTLLDSLAHRNRVELGLQTGDVVEIITGIEPGDDVVVEGQATLRDSSRVKVVTPAR